MKKEVRELLFETETITFTSPQKFASWILRERKQKNLFLKSQNEEPEKYEQDVLYIKELFRQVICFQFLQLLKVANNEENLNIIEQLIKKYRGLDSVNFVTSSFGVENMDLMRCAWDVLKQIEDIINNVSNFVEETKDTNNFFYMLRHHIGHDSIPELRRFASNLSSDLKK